MFKSILVPIDIAQKSSWEFAIPEALDLAAAGKGALTVMTVVRETNAMFEGSYLAFQQDEMISDARTRLASIVHGFAARGIEIEREVRFGGIGREILWTAKDRKVDLILMASHRPEMLDYLIGPNAAYVAQHAPCSVLVLRRFAASPAQAGI